MSTPLLRRPLAASGFVLLCACYDYSGTREAGLPVGNGDAAAQSSPDGAAQVPNDATLQGSPDGGGPDARDGSAQGPNDATLPIDGGSLRDTGTADAGAITDISTDQKSGTRIKGRYYKNADGVREFLGWQDTMRNTPCDFKVASDGVVRCLPPAISVSSFSDSACQRPIVSVPGNYCGLPEAGGLVDRSTCPSRLKVFARTTELMGTGGAPASYYYRSGENCAGPNTGQVGYKTYNLSAEVPASSFVAATDNAVELTSGFRVVRHMSEDGAVSFGRLEDKAGGFACDLRLAKDSTYRCLPRTAAGYTPGSTFADAACTKPATLDGEPACPAAYAIQTSNSGCAPTITVHKVTALGTMAFNLLGTMCNATSAPQLARYDTVVMEVPATTFKSPAIVDGPRFGRLQQRQFELAPGVRKFHQWLDTQTNDDCVFLPASDGQIRCLPIAVQPAAIFGSYFSDAACTKAIATSTLNCPPKYAMSAEFNLCPNRRHIFPVTTEYSGTIYNKSGTTCAAGMLPAGQKGWNYGPELDANAMVRADEVIE